MDQSPAAEQAAHACGSYCGNYANLAAASGERRGEREPLCSNRRLLAQLASVMWRGETVTRTAGPISSRRPLKHEDPDAAGCGALDRVRQPRMRR